MRHSVDDEGFDEQHTTTVPAKVFLAWPEDQRAELALQLLLSVSSLTLAHITARLTPLLQRDFLSLLPAELAIHILSFANACSLGRVAQVCRRWRQLSVENRAWKASYFRKGWSVNETYLDRLLLCRRPSDLSSSMSLSSALSLQIAHSTSLLSTANTLSERLDASDASVHPRLYGMVSASQDIPISSLSSHRHIQSPDSIHFDDETISLGNLGSPSLHTMGYSLGSNMFGSPPNADMLHDAPPHSDHLISQSVSHAPSSGIIAPLSYPGGALLDVPESISLSAVATTDRYIHLDWKHIYHERHRLEKNWYEGVYSARNINAHDEAIYCLQFDENKIVSGSRDDTIKIWDMKSGMCTRTLVGHTASVLCLQYNDTILVSGSSDSSIIVWNLGTGQVLRKLRGHTESVLNLRFDDSIIVSCSKDKTIKIWNIRTGDLQRSLCGHHAAINAIQFSNGLVVSASGDRTIKVWQLETGALLRTLSGHTRGIACVQFDGNTIVSGSSDKTIKIWDVHTGFLLHTLTGHKDLVRTLQFDQHRIVSGSYDETIKVWDMQTGMLLHELTGGHSSRVFKLQFNDSKVVSCSQDQHIVVWDFSQGIDARYFCA
ncbi:hypothetical protein BASA50_009002 [Batrachochytrium salamandrivorans]|uniref:F-box domain-containing protein n=1 Tax=Batrachochytrium salamandrivorans TaxID=1357716 RepID=A0ABQ8F2J7_9FUNG|nr:hypothetical protein BASA62_000066 [Batrachochytrium salamandrivorans]KAH6573055.1 hypothetical protein BASA60_006222 [Batrachochytrium salamandrivorans]KAH6578433.1 hypothetical protein BASA61_000191 [Batrachochytrium salamandrivorans]KAH6591001.1 hypothetical protein BASA50_009002 [Batrachochytrium salamandrivorans]KAH9277270.1 hypothetical protein BASA83_000137 [Batrachochytrium salamandrivorans]